MQKRIITVSESKDLYTKKFNDILQRDLKSARIGKIKDYLLKNPERFFGSLVVAIHGGAPIWSEIDLDSQFMIGDNEPTDNEIDFFEKKLGILTLRGDEVIFALDGQHRLLGIRRAFDENPAIGDEEVPIIIVVHKAEAKERTRRLFTVLNKYAQKPQGAELIIVDEDDAHAILTRRLFDQLDLFKKPNAVSKSHTANIPVSDLESFTTLVTIYTINKVLLKNHKINVDMRPSIEDLDKYFKEIESFWSLLFRQFPEIESFIEGNKPILNGIPFDRNNLNGGTLLLRPVGQVMIANVYMEAKKKNKVGDFLSKVREVDFNLSCSNWKYLLWNGGKMIPKNEALSRRSLLVLLGLEPNPDEVNRLRSKFYTDNEISAEKDLIAL